MKELKIKIECELRTLNELYDFYLEKLEEEPYNSYYESRLNEMRVQIRTYEKVLEMMENVWITNKTILWTRL